MRRCLPLLALLACSACGERAKLLIEVRHPPGLDPAAAKGTLTVSVSRVDDGQRVTERTIETEGLGTRQRLFDDLDLQQGERYRLGLSVQFDAQEAVCTTSSRRAVGQSPPFDHDRETERITVYVDCADAASPTGNPAKARILHTATLLPTPAPHGQVLVVGGAETGTDPENPESAVLLDTMESYDPATGQFTALDARLSRPRIFHATSVDPQGDAVVTGGMDKVVSVGTTYLASVKSVERVRDGRVSKLAEMTDARGGHGVARVGETLVLAGGLANFAKALQSVEIYDLAGKATTAVLSMKWPRVTMVAVALDDRRVLLSGGVRLAGADIEDELLCLSGSCPCGAPPCVESLGFGFGKGLGRYGLTGTRVGCSEPDKGAVYLVGGNYTENNQPPAPPDYRYFDDIYCVDLQSPTALIPAGKLKRPRSGHTTTLLRDGAGRTRLFVAGGGARQPGASDVTVWNTAELIDVSCDCKVTAQREIAMKSYRSGHTATLLSDGTVLLLGGLFSGTMAERFNPAR